ncbi:MAG TPA: BRO family protein [Clostridiales bacterium]|nr:BRO family protein [Clostridiales bacterium]
MNELQIFRNQAFGEIRTVEINGKPYFAAVDIARALGYSNTRDAISRHCKGVVKHDGVSKTTNQHGVETEQVTEMTFIQEGDIYRLIVKSQLPSAEKFERWVFDEVLPSIRKHGMYMEDDILNQILSNPDFGIILLTKYKEEKEKSSLLGDQVIEQQKLISTLKPKANYVDRILSSRSLVATTQIAKDYGYSAIAFNRLLRDLGVQFKVNDQWVLYAKYQNEGYTHSRTIDITRGDGKPDIVMQTEWTQKGRLFLYELLKQKGIVPVIEKPTQLSFEGLGYAE